MKIKSKPEYIDNYKSDPMLPSRPDQTYKYVWKSWYDFLGTKVPSWSKHGFYTYIEAKTMVKKLKIKSQREYFKRYNEDPKLPGDPEKKYKGKGWIDWYDFLGKEKPLQKYQSYDEAKKAVVLLNIRSKEEYIERYKEDKKLPANPYIKYRNKGWISWPDFLGKTDKT